MFINCYNSLMLILSPLSSSISSQLLNQDQPSLRSPNYKRKLSTTDIDFSLKKQPSVRAITRINIANDQHPALNENDHIVGTKLLLHNCARHQSRWSVRLSELLSMYERGFGTTGIIILVPTSMLWRTV